MSTPKVAAEVAELDFTRWCEALDLDTNVEKLNNVEKLYVAAFKGSVVAAIMDGRVTISEDGTLLSYRARKSDVVVKIRMPIGQDIMNGASATESIGRTAMILAAMNDCAPSRFTALQARDVRWCESVLGFLAAP